MITFTVYLITCLCFTPVVNKSFDNIGEYGFFRLIIVTFLWPAIFVLLAVYIVYNKCIDFYEDLQ